MGSLFRYDVPAKKSVNIGAGNKSARFSCETCNRGFKTEANYTKHIGGKSHKEKSGISLSPKITRRSNRCKGRIDFGEINPLESFSREQLEAQLKRLANETTTSKPNDVDYIGQRPIYSEADYMKEAEALKKADNSIL